LSCKKCIKKGHFAPHACKNSSALCKLAAETWKNLCRYIFITPVDRKGCSALRRFLNDVQKAKTPAQYSINSTFLSGQVSASNFNAFDSKFFSPNRTSLKFPSRKIAFDQKTGRAGDDCSENSALASRKATQTFWHDFRQCLVESPRHQFAFKSGEQTGVQQNPDENFRR
jgi:hypothetical protein